MNKSKTKIVFTGGHAGTAAATIVSEAQRRGLDWEIHWIGPKKATEGKNHTTLEAKVFPGLGIKFHSIVAGRLQRKFTVWTVPALIKIPWGFVQALKLLLEIRPKLIFSFGGFAAFPVVVVGWLMGIPVIIHEQTAAAGRANQVSAFFAKKILLARAESISYFPVRKCVVVGNPVPEIFFKITKKNLSGRPVIFVTGGSRGSQIINEKLFEALPELLLKYKVVHQVGEANLSKFEGLIKRLEPQFLKEYEVLGFFDPEKMAFYLTQADVVVGRAGANTVSEVIAAGKPTLFIPIPWSYLDEQTKNAEYAGKFIPVEIASQEKLNAELFLAKINSLIIKAGSFVPQEKENPDRTAAQNIVRLTESYLKK